MSIEGDKIKKLETKFLLPPPTEYDQSLMFMDNLEKLEDFQFYESLKDLVITNIVITEMCPATCPCSELSLQH